MAMTFGTTTISYFEGRSDGGFAWNVAYDLTGTASGVTVSLRIDLVGADAGATAETWESGAEEQWNREFFFSDGNRLFELALDVDFVDSDAHQTVTVHAGVGGANMTNWYLVPEGWGTAFHDEIAAHEVGHMLGAFDEYSGGATLNGLTATGTLMSDLSHVVLARNITGLELATEGASGVGLTVVAAVRGGVAADDFIGTSGMDGWYGGDGGDTASGQEGNDFLVGDAGADRIYGGGGGDMLRGSAGRDVLGGGMGADTMNGGGGGDRFVFDTDVGAGGRDRIQGFDATADVFQLSRADFVGLSGTVLANHAFRFGSEAQDASDRILFDETTGILRFDQDGAGGADAVVFAVINGLSGTLVAADFDLIA